MGITDRFKGKAWSKSMKLPVAQISNKMAFLIALIGGLIAAAFAMLIPISTLESFTGATGLSEIIPATGAPLGSSARILFVIFTAILAASILLVLLLSLRKEPEKESIYSDDNYVNEMARERNRMALSEDDSELAERIYQEDEQNYQNYQQNNDVKQDENVTAAPKKNIAAIAGGAIAAGSAGLLATGSSIKSKFKKLPFMGGDDGIKSFDDLPKLRGADKHPDAPARRPISAHEDLGERILDREPPQKSDAQEKALLGNLESNLSDIEQSESTENENPIDGVETKLDQASKIPNDVHLQSQDLNEANIADDMSAKAATKSEELTEDIIAPVARENNADHHDAKAAAPVASQPIAKADVAQDDSALPTIDDLMERLGSLVERRSRRVETQKSEAIKPVEIKPAEKMEAKPTDKSEAQLDDYAAVIDHAAIKRAEKSAQNNEKDNREAADIIERPKAALKSADSSQLDDDGDTVVTKSQKAEMDNALKSALDTLHKMTERSA